MEANVCWEFSEILQNCYNEASCYPTICYSESVVCFCIRVTQLFLHVIYLGYVQLSPTAEFGCNSRGIIEDCHFLCELLMKDVKLSATSQTTLAVESGFG